MIKVTKSKDFDKTIDNFIGKLKTLQEPNKYASLIPKIKDRALELIQQNLNNAFNLKNAKGQESANYDFLTDIQTTVTETSVIITLGENSKRATMNGNLVNPFYFVEFGFGYTGTLSSTEAIDNARNVGWAYDINNHGAKGWYFNGKWTNGARGSAFLFNTIKQLQKELKDMAYAELKKVGF